MLLLDVNILLGAHRADHRDHTWLHAWLTRAATGDEDFGVPLLVWGSFLRLVTNRRVFSVPTPRSDAFAFIDGVRAQPRYLSTEPGPRHLALLQGLCDEGDAAGDLVPDAILGAIAMEHGAGVASLDRDFARFASLRQVRPAPGPADG